jgi:hypothetical protein
MNKKIFRFRPIIGTLVFIYSLIIFASGTMQLEGKIVSLSKEKIEIDDSYHIYLINRNKLANNKNLNNAKVGDSLLLTLSFDAIEQTKTLSK